MGRFGRLLAVIALMVGFTLACAEPKTDSARSGDSCISKEKTCHKDGGCAC